MDGSYKHKREELGLSVQEVSDRTRLKRAFVTGIEEGDFSVLPAEVYSRGYIREYARFLGLDPAVKLAAYEAFLEEKKRSKKKEQPKPVALHPEPPEQKTPPPRIEKSGSAAGSDKPLFGLSPTDMALRIAALVVIVVIAYSYIGGSSKTKAPVHELPAVVKPTAEELARRNEVREENVFSPPSETGSQPAGEGDERSAGKQEPLRPAAAERKPEKSAQQAVQAPKAESGSAAAHSLEITATEKVWLQITIDGSDKRVSLLAPGDSVEYGAKKRFDVLIGNASGVKINFDGKNLEKLGGKNEVVKLRLPGGKVE